MEAHHTATGNAWLLALTRAVNKIASVVSSPAWITYPNPNKCRQSYQYNYCPTGFRHTRRQKYWCQTCFVFGGVVVFLIACHSLKCLRSLAIYSCGLQLTWIVGKTLELWTSPSNFRLHLSRTPTLNSWRGLITLNQLVVSFTVASRFPGQVSAAQNGEQFYALWYWWWSRSWTCACMCVCMHACFCVWMLHSRSFCIDNIHMQHCYNKD